MQFICTKVIQISCFTGDISLAACKTILLSSLKRESSKNLIHQFPSLFAYLSTYPKPVSFEIKLEISEE